MSPLGEHCRLCEDGTVRRGSRECRVSLKGAPDHGDGSIRRQREPESVVNYQEGSCSWRGHRIPALPLRLSLRFNRFSLLRSAGGEAVNQPEKHGKRLISRRLRRGGGDSGEERLVPPRRLRRPFCELIRCSPSARTPTNKRKWSRRTFRASESSAGGRSIKNKSTQLNGGVPT